MTDSYPNSGDSASPGDARHWSEETSFERLSEIVARLKARVDDAISARDDFAGDAAHEELINAEARLRMAERRRDRG